MPKIEINQVAEIMKRNKADPSLLRSVVQEMNLIAQASIDEDRPPAIKKQFVILISDPLGLMPKEDFAGWVVQMPDDESPVTLKERIFRAAYDYNASKRGRLLPAKTVGEAIESVPTKFTKEVDIWIKTKTPVLVVTTDNEIPRDDRYRE